MPTSRDMVEAVERLRTTLEQRWHLPWVKSVVRPSVFEHEILLELSALDDSSLLDVVEALLAHPSHALRGLAIHLAAPRFGAALADRFRDALFDSSVHVRAMATAALGRVGDEYALEALLETKDAEHPEVKKAVVDALRLIRDTRSIPILARWVGRVGEDDQLRMKACAALGAIGDDAAMPALERVLDDDNLGREVRLEAALAMARIASADARAALHKRSSDPDPDVRAFCAQAFGVLGDRSQSEVLARLLDPKEAGLVRREAVSALATLGGQPAVSALAVLAKDDDERLRLLACTKLGAISPEADPALRRALERALDRFLDDRSRAIRVIALRHLERVTGRSFGLSPTLEDAAEAELGAAVERARGFAAGA